MIKRAPILLLVVLLGACGNLLDPAAAVVSGEKITIDKIDEELERFRQTPRYDQLVTQGNESQIARDVQQGYLTLLIRETVLDEEAEERGVEVTPDEVNARVEQTIEDLGSEGQFQEALKEDGITIEIVELNLRIQLLEEELHDEVTADIGPSESEIRAHYEESTRDYQEVRAQHILVADLAQAQELAAQLQKASAKNLDELFADLAKKHSEDPISSKQGGDLGWSLPTSFEKPFADAVAKLPIGEVSDAVETQFGFHVIRVTARRLTPFEQARASIEEELEGPAVQQAWEEWLRDAYREADIRVNSRFGEFHIDSLSVGNATAEDVPAGEAPLEPSPSL